MAVTVKTKAFDQTVHSPVLSCFTRYFVGFYFLSCFNLKYTDSRFLTRSLHFIGKKTFVCAFATFFQLQTSLFKCYEETLRNKGLYVYENSSMMMFVAFIWLSEFDR